MCDKDSTRSDAGDVVVRSQVSAKVNRRVPPLFFSSPLLSLSFQKKVSWWVVATSSDRSHVGCVRRREVAITCDLADGFGRQTLPVTK